ncbi:hypothetical protein FKP32DRAFT_1608123 [Trametes sanguinea]|nr:hypothetical protein FKP32DRAFT_1608123 [Trametes sanguinea]
MKAFIRELLGYEQNGNVNLNAGVLGVVKAYYGCVEAQGRGTLHCHMMVWVEGGLNPKELQERLRRQGSEEFGRRLLDYLDDVICNNVPSVDSDRDPSTTSLHPDAHRGFNLNMDRAQLDEYRQADLRVLVEKNQRHKHTGTCYKYCKAGERVCRFDLDESNVIPQSTINFERGEITLRIEDGLINNYNATILEALRCNMDIQFIGCGGEAKAVLYYITDYITKSPLKAHVAYTALEMAMKKLANEPHNQSSDTARRLLQRTAFSILSNQELSSQQVASYLLDFEDHFTSHQFSNLYWRSFEKHVDAVLPLATTRSSHTETNLSHSHTPEPHASEDDSQQSLEDDDDDVRIDADHNGTIVELSTQLADYLYRGDDLRDMSLWDFVRRTRKIPLRQEWDLSRTFPVLI